MISDGAAEAIKEDDAMSVFFMDFDMAPSVIWARDLYDQMQIQSDFRKWFPRMCQYGFVEGRDYEFVPRVRPQDEGGRTVQRYVKDYRITLEMAKQLYKLHHFHKNGCFHPCTEPNCRETDHWMQAIIELLHQHKCKSHAPPKRFYEFDIKELRDLMAYDEMELDMLGDQRTAMFVIISDTDDTFNFVVSILYTQLFNLLCDKADDEHGGRLPYHVRLLLDEFANIGQIPKFDKLIATIRSREISASIILQSQSQLKTIYKDAAETIIGNCDTMLFLGGKESSTLKEISETLGKETIDLYNTSDTRGNSPSFGTNYQKTGKELMSRDELAVMDGSKCILQLRGVRPFLSDKFDITKHKRYKELSDFDKKNEFDVERYLKHELRLLTTEEFDLYEVDVTEQAQG